MGKTLSRLSSALCGFNRLVINDNVYRHKKQLGEGAFSYVDLVEHGKSHQLYALKRIICHDKKVSSTQLDAMNLLE